MNNPWKKLSSKNIYNSKFGFTFREDKVINPSGKESTYIVLDGKGFVAVLPLTIKKEVVMVRQWRYPINKETLEIPAGKIDKQEALLKAAKRELKEETGMTGGNWISLGDYYAANGVAYLHGHLFIATNINPGNNSPEETESIEIELHPFSRVYDMVLKNQINDDRTITAVLLAKTLYGHLL